MAVECLHENVEWVSGVVGEYLTINPFDVVCLDCEMVATVREEN